MLSVLQNIDKITAHSTFRFKCQRFQTQNVKVVVVKKGAKTLESLAADQRERSNWRRFWTVGR